MNNQKIFRLFTPMKRLRKAGGCRFLKKIFLFSGHPAVYKVCPAGGAGIRLRIKIGE